MIVPFERPFHVLVHVRAGVPELDPLDCWQAWEAAQRDGHVNRRVGRIEYMARQETLHGALLAREPVLDRWLRHRARSRVLWGGLQGFRVGLAPAQILGPVLDGMAPFERMYFANAMTRADFSIHAGPFLDAVGVEPVGASVDFEETLPDRGLGLRRPRRYRVEVGMNVRVGEIDPALSARTGRWIGARGLQPVDISETRYTQLQEALLQALLTHPVRLDLWLKNRVLECIHEQGAAACDPGLSHEVFIEALLEHMYPQCRAYYEDALERGSAWEAGAAVLEAETARIERLWIGALEPSR